MRTFRSYETSFTIKQKAKISLKGKKMKTSKFILVSALLFGSIAFAQTELNVLNQVDDFQQDEYSTQKGNQPLHTWYFLGCADTAHSCEHHANEHGYHHSKARPDHHRCDHHNPYACYGRN
jgi:hypothetical protein